MTRTSRLPPTLILAACVVALGVGLVAQYGFGLRPCILCLYQRVPYAVAGVLAIPAILASRSVTRRLPLALCAVAFGINMLIASFHVGVEQHWWPGLPACEAEGPALPDSSEALLSALKGPPPARCDDIPVEVYGVSMAGANVPVSLFLALYAAVAAKRSRRR